MEIIDLLIFIVVGIGIAMGYSKGGVKLLASMIGLILGLYIAKIMYIPLSEMLCPSITESMGFAKTFAFILIWIAVPILCTFAGSLFTKTLEAMHINWLNRWVGAGLGGFKYLLLISLFINVVEFIDGSNHLISLKTKKNSVCYYPSKKIVGAVFPLVKTVSKQYIR